MLCRVLQSARGVECHCPTDLCNEMPDDACYEVFAIGMQHIVMSGNPETVQWALGHLVYEPTVLGTVR